MKLSAIQPRLTRSQVVHVAPRPQVHRPMLRPATAQRRAAAAQAGLLPMPAPRQISSTPTVILPHRPGLPASLPAWTLTRPLVQDGRTSHVLSEPFAHGCFGEVSYVVDVTNPNGPECIAKEVHLPHSTAVQDKRLKGQRAESIEREINAMRLANSRLAPSSVIPMDDRYVLIMPRMAGDLDALHKPKIAPLLDDGQRRIMLRSAFRQVCSELAAMHEQGLLHQDIKPGNILFHPDGGVCLSDFGASQTLGPDGTLQKYAGAPAMAPLEAVFGQPFDAKAETWSLFVTWCAAVVSEGNPFVSGSPGFFFQLMNWLDAHPNLDDAEPLRQQPDAFSKLFVKLFDFDPEMTRFGLRQALLNDPDERATMAQFRDTLEGLQPANSEVEGQARHLFRKIAAVGSEAPQSYAALRRDARNVQRNAAVKR